MLIEGSGLTLVIQWASVLGDGMGELVSDDIDAASEVVQKFTTVAKYHLTRFGVPNLFQVSYSLYPYSWPRFSCLERTEEPREEGRLTGIFVFLSKVNRAEDIGILVVDGLPLKVLLVKFQDKPNIVESFVYSSILDFGLSFGTDQFAGKVCLAVGVVGIVDGTVWCVFGILVVVLRGCSCNSLLLSIGSFRSAYYKRIKVSIRASKGRQGTASNLGRPGSAQ